MADKNTQNMASIVIFGATGDLTHRKLIPALFSQYCKGNLPEQFSITGFAFDDETSDSLRERLQDGVATFAKDKYTDDSWKTFAERIHYIKGNLTEVTDFEALDKHLSDIEDGASDRLYYLAISPRFIESTVNNLGNTGMNIEDNGARKIIIEKPFGHDLESAIALNDVVHSVFQEDQIFRIDHYLGKETAQNLLFFRFANTVFESVWDRAHIDNVQISVTESVDVGHRAGYYDTAGVLRDMFQNHLLQLLTLTAMEPPASFNANELRNEKVKVLRAVRPLEMKNVVRAQYRDYRDTKGVADKSMTPTFAALKLHVDNWRWQGVPFYLRSGKALKNKGTEITIQFKKPPRMMFDLPSEFETHPNMLSMCIQPDEGVHFSFEAKKPSDPYRSQSVDMEFHYMDAFGEGAIPEAYERLLVDALNGDASLFIRSDEIETAWRIIDPILQYWEGDIPPPMFFYERNTWGPLQADKLLKDDEFDWNIACMHD